MSRAKTTVYLDAAEYQRLKAIARRERRAPAALVREAVKEYAQRHDRRPVPRSLGAGCSGGGEAGRTRRGAARGDGAVSVIVAGYLAATQLGHRVPRDL